MVAYYLLLISAIVFIFLLGVTFGHSLLILKLRKEENKRRELELSILSKKPPAQLKRVSLNESLEEMLFKAEVEKEINNLLRKQEGN